MAINLIKTFTDNTRECVDDVLVIRYLKHFKMDCLELAIESKCEKFVSNSMVQNILDKIWTGERNLFEYSVQFFFIRYRKLNLNIYS